MNKKQQELLDEAYAKYVNSHLDIDLNGRYLITPTEHDKESFINECKVNFIFSKKWGLDKLFKSE